MIGMDATTGKALGGEAHLRQSILRIITTPLGTRVMRRDFGSLVQELIDQPFNAGTRMRVLGATVTALMRWEPRVSVRRVDLRESAPGSYLLDLDLQLRDRVSNDRLRQSIPLSSHRIH